MYWSSTGWLRAACRVCCGKDINKAWGFKGARLIFRKLYNSIFQEYRLRTGDSVAIAWFPELRIPFEFTPWVSRSEPHENRPNQRIVYLVIFLPVFHVLSREALQG